MSTNRRDVARMLTSYSRRTLETWAIARGLDPTSLRGNALSLELAGLLLAPVLLKQALGEASPEERLTLARLKLEGGRLPPEELKAQLLVDGLTDPDAALTALMRRGLLFYDRSMEQYGYGRWEIWGAEQKFHGAVPPFWLPGELLEMVTVPDDLGHLPLEVVAEPPQVREAPFSMLQRDIYLLLHALQTQPVKLLKSGEVGKRESARLLQILPRTGAAEGDPTAGARSCGDWFEFLWLLLQRAGLVAIGAGQVEAADAGIRFLAQSEAEQARMLYQAWLHLPEWNEFSRVPTLEFEYAGHTDYPHPTHLQAARQSVGELLVRQAVYPGWYSVDSLLQSVKRFRVAFLIFRANTPRYFTWETSSANDDRRYRGFFEARSKPRRYFNKDTDWEQVEGAYLRTLLAETFAWLGIVRLGYADGKLVSFQLTERGAFALGVLKELPARSQEGVPAAGGSSRSASEARPDRALIVQPNFEVIVYPEIAGVPVLVELDRFAERVRMDRAAIYRLTRPALCRGLQAGMTLDEIVGTLERQNGGPLPQNVAYTLDEWRQLYDRIRVLRCCTLIEAEDDRELQELRRLPELATAREVATGVFLAPDDWAPRRLRGGVERFDYTAPITNAIEFESGRCLRIVPGARSPQLVHRLSQIAEPVDLASTAFALSAEKVRAAAKWWPWEAMHAFLMRASKTTPGPELGVTLKGWAGGLPAAALTSVTMLAAPSAAWLDQVLLIPEVRSLILQRLSPTLAVVAGENRERLDAALAEIGVSIGDAASLKEVMQSALKADSEAGETLLVGPPRKRRALMEQAIAEGRRLAIAMLPYGGRLTTTNLNPIRVEGEGSGAYLVAKVDGLRYEQHYALNRISGVRMLDESQKS
jgi:hypothetical protein